MERTHRFGAIVFATVCIVVILITASISVAFAYWLIPEGSVPTISADGQVGLYYVGYDKPYVEDGVKYGEASATVRHVKSDKGTVFHNYVCVKRENQYGADGSLIAATPSVAYVDFSVTGDDLDATVVGFTVERARTGGGGIPCGSALTHKIFGDPTGKKLSYINGNTYLRLDFGSGEDMFYALNVTVTTDVAAEYTFTATVTYKDTHTYAVEDSYYLGIDDFEMRESVYVGSVGDDSDFIDASMIITLTAGQSFKLFSTAADASGAVIKDKYFAVESSSDGAYIPNIKYYPQTLSQNFTAPTGNGGNEANITVNTSGKYMLRWYGRVSHVYSVDYTVESIEITLVDPIEESEELDVETTDAGYYIVGAFTEGRTFNGLKMSPSADLAGVYEKTAKSLTIGESYQIAYRATDGGALVKYDTSVVYSSSVGADGADIAFDALVCGEPDTSVAHRFIVDFADLGFNGDEDRTLNYRATVTGASKSVPLIAAARGEFDGKYYADVRDDVIVSVTVKATSDTVRHNSFDINSITVGRKCVFDYRSYEIRCGALVGEGNKSNWTGVARSYADGEYSVDIPFGLNLATIANGYAVVYNRIGETGYTYNNTFIPMQPSENPDWEYSLDLDTRAGKAHNALIGKEFLIYHNGNAMSAELDDGIIRITHEQDTHAYRIIEHEKAQGKFVVKVRKSYYDQSQSRYTDNLNILFIAGAAIDEKPITASSPSVSGYYIMGQFSGWEIYPSNRMTETNIFGAYTATLDSVITTDDILESVPGIKPGMYKIVYIPENGEFMYYGAINDSVAINGDSSSNMPITSPTFYFDSFKAKSGGKASEAFTTRDKLDSVYRIVFNNTSGLTDLRVHYWDSNMTWGNGNNEAVCNWSTGGNITSTSALRNWDNRPSMESGVNGYYYYDVRSDAQYWGTYMTISGVKLTYGYQSKTESDNLYPEFTTTNGIGYRSYMIRYSGGAWSGSEYKGVNWTEYEYVEPTDGDEEIQVKKLGSGEYWAMSYDLTAKNASANGNWYFGAYVGARRQLVGVEMSKSWDESVNIYGHIFPVPPNNDKERVMLSQSAVDLLESVSETHPVTVMFVRVGEFVKVYASDGSVSMHLATVSLARFIANNEEDVTDGVGVYEYDDNFGYGWRNNEPIRNEDGEIVEFKPLFGNPTIKNVRFVTGEQNVALACDEYKTVLAKTDCTTEYADSYIGDYVRLIADPPQTGTIFSYFEVDGVKIDGDTFLVTNALHRVRAVYVGVSSIKIAEHDEYVRTHDGMYTLPHADVVAPDGSIDGRYTVTTTVEDLMGKQYAVKNGVADLSDYVGSMRLKITYKASGLVGKDTETVYVTVQREGDTAVVYQPLLRSIGLIDDAGKGIVEFDARVRHGDDTGSLKFTPNSEDYGIMLDDFDFDGYDTIKFYVYAEAVTEGMFAGILWAGDTTLVAGEWVEISVSTSHAGIFLVDNNGNEYAPNAPGRPEYGGKLRGRLVLRIRNGKDIPVWISSIRAYKSGT